MAVITPTTFDPLRRYVNVRLQQGVPIVDADWNELDDVRKFELRAFLKWFVGDGVPDGNDGFRVSAAAAGSRAANVAVLVGGQGPAPANAAGETVALRHAGRAVVDGLDVMIEADLGFRAQPLHTSAPTAAALAVELGVPVIAEMPAAGPVLIYLDVWERLVTPSSQPGLLLPALGVESCARIRREWVVRARAGTVEPAAGDADFLAGHAYLPLAVVTRREGVADVTEGDIADVRPRRLLVPPSHLLADTLGVDAGAYRRGEDRPPISLRDAVNALLAGELPTSADLPASPADNRADVGRRALTLAGGALVVAWTAPRSGNANQIVTAQLDLGDIDRGFSTAQVVTSGLGASAPTAVGLPGGDVLLCYQSGPSGAATTDVVLRRAPFAGLTAAAERPVFSTASVADERPYAVAIDDVVVVLGFTRAAAGGTWVYRRYRPATDAFADAAPQTLVTSAASPNADLHACAAPGGGSLWVAWEDGGTVHGLSFQPADGGIDTQQAFPTSGTGNPFILADSADAATLFWQQAGASPGVFFADAAAGAWGPATPLPDSTGETDPCAARDDSGRTWLFTSRPAAAGADLYVRTRHPVTREWAPARRVVAAAGADQLPHPLFASGQGIWLQWTSTRRGNPDVFVKRIVTVL